MLLFDYYKKIYKGVFRLLIIQLIIGLVLNFIIALIQALITLVIPYIIALSISLVSKGNVKKLSKINSRFFIKLICIPGIIIHELGHIFMAIIFRHKITSFKLITFTDKYKESNGKTLNGYVNTQNSKDSIYQGIGKYFIGIAPIFSCFASILIIFSIIFGNPFSSSFLKINGNFSNDWTIFTQIFMNIVNDFYSGYILSIMLFLSFLVLIGTYGFSLSDLDLKISVDGLSLAVPTFTIVFMLVSFLGFVDLLNGFIIKYLIIITILSAFIIVFLMILKALISLITLIFKLI